MDVNNQQPGAEPLDRECVGSFMAYAADQSGYVIEVWAHRDAIHYGDPKRISPAKLFLVTKDGRHVDRVEQGEYRVKGDPEIMVTTTDLNAP